MPVAEAELANLSTEEQVRLANEAADKESVTSPQDPPEPTTADTEVVDDPVEPVADAQDTQVLEYIRARIGDQPWLKNFKTADDLIKAIPEMQSLIGRQSGSVAALRNMEAMGLTVDEAARWLASKNQPAPAAPTQSTDAHQSFAVRGQDGKFYPTAKSPANWESILNQELAAATDRLLNPSQMAEALKPYLMPAVEQENARTRQEVQAVTDNAANETRFNSMVEQNRNLYYTEDGAYSQFGKRVQELLQEKDPNFGHTISVQMPDWKRLEKAHALAMREMPKAQTRTVPANAKPITQPKVTPSKATSADDWMKANTFDGNKDLQFRAFNDAVNRGEVKLD